MGLGMGEDKGVREQNTFPSNEVFHLVGPYSVPLSVDMYITTVGIKGWSLYGPFSPTPLHFLPPDQLKNNHRFQTITV